MKTIFKKLTAATAVVMFGVVGAQADTSVIQDGVGGWTKITAIPETPGDYYFVFVDNSQDLMLSFGEGVNQSTNAAYKTMVYRTSEDPAMNPAMLWTLTANDGGYSIKSAVEATYYLQTEGNAEWYCRTHDNGGGSASWYKWILAYADGSWTIQNGKYTDKGYIGGWDAAPKNGLNVAANNTAADKVGYFQIYAILKTAVDWMGNASKSKPANLSYKIANSYAAFNGTTGWTSAGTGLNDDGRNDGTGFDGVAGFFEYWSGNSYSGTLSQVITGLPEGLYKVRAAAQLASANTTLALDVNGTSVNFDANGTGNGTIDQTCAEVAAGSGVAGWQYKSVNTTLLSSGSITITFTSTTTAGGCWTNFDNVELYYLGSTGSDYTSKITNFGFETGDLTGWTVNTSNDTGVYSTTNDTYKTIGSTGDYLFNNWWTGTPITQNIGVLPAGVYQLSADVATGNDASSIGTLYLNANDARSTGYASSNNKIMGTEHLVFYSDGSSSTTIGLRGGENASVSAAGAIVKGAWSEDGYWWYKCDNFRLAKIGETAGELAERLSSLVATNAPYNDVEDITSYTANFNTYKNYTSSNTIAELVEAINYITNEYDDYCWNNASVTHPVDVTEGIISGAACTSNDAWPGSGRTTATGTYYDGSSRTYFTQNHENGAARSQNVTISYEGAYLLRTIVKPVYAGSYATITIGDESTTTSGVQTGSNNIGNGWAYNDVYYGQNATNVSKTIYIALSNANSGREADCGEMHLYYIGRNADFVTGGVHKFVGIYPVAPSLELTVEVPVANMTAATFSSGTSSVTFTNPNGLVFASSNGQVSSTAKNVVVNGTCASLQLEKGHPFVNPTEFTATNAKYTLAAGELAGGQFATLMIPFAATTLAGTAYTLDQGVNLFDGNIYGTSTSTISANSPVLVTASGNYIGSSVTVPAVASGATYTNGELVGTYTATTAPAGSYVLQNHTSGEGVAFYIVGNTKPTVSPFRAYIRTQSSNAKAIRVHFDNGADAIEAVSADMVAEGATYFTIDGRQLSAPQRGINLMRQADGTVRKILVK